MKEQGNKDTSAQTIDQSIDRLTGLLNLDVFQIILEWESARSRRYGTLFTLALLDIDSFSLYNKRHGMPKGDEILKMIARTIKRTIRRSDIAARYSGDVFALILTSYPTEPSHRAVERIRAEIEAFTRGEVTLSAGLATTPQDAIYGNILMDKTREALALAKAGGGNKTYFSTAERKTAIVKKPQILLVGDPEQTKDTQALIESSGPDLEIIKSSAANEALLLVERMGVDLVLVNAMMPETDGYEICRRLKENDDTRFIPVIILTTSSSRKDRIRAIELGAGDCLVTPPDRMELMARIRSLLREGTLNKKLTSIENVLISMANAVEAKDVYTQGHSVRVSDMAVTLGKKMNLSEDEIEALRLGGILHDIGKIGVPGEILNRPGKLTPDEFEIVKTHPEASCTICEPLQKTLGSALDVIRHHHERLDGSGYPDGLKGKEISVIARIAGIVDIFDALIANRPYRGAMSREGALGILQKNADEGRLDKTIVGHFIEMIGES